MSEEMKKLFSEFEAPTAQAWVDKIQVDLKGDDYQKKMIWRTNEGFNMQPFYRKEDNDKLQTPDALPGEFPYVRGNNKYDNDWFVRQNIVVSNVVEANKKALDILSKGVNSLGFLLTAAIDANSVTALLEGILCDCVEVNFGVKMADSKALAKVLVDYFDVKGYDKERIVCSVEWDAYAEGQLNEEAVKISKDLMDIVAAYPNFRVISVNSVDLSNKGAYIVQELGYSLAWGAEYLQQLTAMGVDTAKVAQRMKFNMGISENYFMEIAKFRAARMLWSQILKQFEPAEESAYQMCINAETSSYNMTLFDPYVNILRTQTETMSASIAGVHSIVVNPFDRAYVDAKELKEDSFAERIARNQQLLLKEESHFDKVVDPSAGSYFIEQLTNSLATEAWKVFLKVEEDGGFIASVKEGIIQADLQATDDKRHLQASQRREFILGTNQFPNFTEKSEGKVPLDFPHLSSEFETVRLTTEKATKQPVAFMLTIGSLVWRQARAQFSCNFLAAAGYKVIDNLGFQTVEEGVDAAMKADADIVVLCSSDDEYATYAVPAFNYLGGKALFIVAGAPACMEELKAAGIETFINVKSNQLDTLKMINSKLGL